MLAEIYPSLQNAIEVVRDSRIFLLRIQLVYHISPFVSYHVTIFLAIIVQHDDVLERQGPRGVSWKTNPTPINPALANSAKYSLNTSTTFHTKLYQRQTEEEEAEHFVRLCRGENLRVSFKMRKFLFLTHMLRDYRYPIFITII